MKNKQNKDQGPVERLNTLDTLFVGLKGHVVAFSKRDGTQLWKTKLRGGLSGSGGRFVNLLAESDRVYVHTYGELFCLDASTGEQLWSDGLAGLGYEVAMLAVVGLSSPPVAAIVQHGASDGGDAGATTAGA